MIKSKNQANNIDTTLMMHSLKSYRLTSHSTWYKNVFHTSNNMRPKRPIESIAAYPMNNCSYSEQYHPSGLNKLLKNDVNSGNFITAVNVKKNPLNFLQMNVPILITGNIL